MKVRARRATDPLTVVPTVNRRKDRPNRPNGLTKQTYSALVYLPGSTKPKKWHLVAYFTVRRHLISQTYLCSHIRYGDDKGDDYTRLPVIESYDYLNRLKVPQGIYVSSKANGLKSEQMLYADWGDICAIAPSTSLDSTDYSRQTLPSATVSPFSVSNWHLHSHLPPPRQNSDSEHRAVSLPGIASLTSSHPGPGLRVEPRRSDHIQLGHPSPTSYRPLSAEDRRALNSFRVVL